MTPFQTAQRYIASEQHEAVRLRDVRANDAQTLIARGDIVAALAAQLDVARLAGKIVGLNTASIQLDIVRERVQEGHTA